MMGIAITLPMTPEAIRLDLEQQLSRLGVDLKAASLAIGRNHSYLHQFVRYAKPRYLHEEDRRALADLYQINVDALVPPTKKTLVKSQVSLNRAPRPGDPIKDFQEAALVGTWRNLSEEHQALVLKMLDGLGRGPSGTVAA